MRTLCLNVTYEPLGFLSQDRAVVCLIENKADLIEQDVSNGNGVYRSAGGLTVPKPSVIRLNRYIKVPRSLKECITPRVLFARDGFTCQYCGKHQSELKNKNR